MSDIKVYVVPRKGSRNLYLEVRCGKERLDRKTTGSDDPRVAERLRSELEAELRAATGETLGDIWTAHVLFRRGRGVRFSEATEANYESARLRFDQLLDTPLALITPERLAEAHDGLAVRYSGNTLRSTFNCLRRVWRWATKRGRAPDYPGHPEIEVEDTDKEPLTPEELVVFLAWVKDYLRGRWYVYFLLLASTGARASEILGLKGRAVDHDRCELSICKRQRGNKTRRAKTLAVPPAVMKLVPKVPDDQLLFDKVRAAYRDGTPTSPRVTLKVFRRGLEACGVSAERAALLDQHSIRRTWCSIAHREGVPLAVAMAQMGHKSPSVNLKYQARAATPEVHDAVEQVSQLFAAVFQEGQVGEELGEGGPPLQAAIPVNPSEFQTLFRVPVSC